MCKKWNLESLPDYKSGGEQENKMLYKINPIYFLLK